MAWRSGESDAEGSIAPYFFPRFGKREPDEGEEMRADLIPLFLLNAAVFFSPGSEAPNPHARCLQNKRVTHRGKRREKRNKRDACPSSKNFGA